MRRYRFHPLTFVATLAAVGVAGVWARSMFADDRLRFAVGGRSFEVRSHWGVMTIGNWHLWEEHWLRRKAVEREQDAVKAQALAQEDKASRMGAAFAARGRAPGDAELAAYHAAVDEAARLRAAVPPLPAAPSVRPVNRVVPYQLLLVPLPLWLIVRHARRRRRAARQAQGLCPRCGYDLRASPGRCPECGAVTMTPTPASP